MMPDTPATDRSSPDSPIPRPQAEPRKVTLIVRIDAEVIDPTWTDGDLQDSVAGYLGGLIWEAELAVRVGDAYTLSADLTVWTVDDGDCHTERCLSLRCPCYAEGLDPTAEQRLRVARFVADHWRLALLDSPMAAAHPLCMVLAALDGETDPLQCGIEEDAHPAFLAALEENNR